MPGYRVDKLDDIIPTMKKAQAHNGPVLIEMVVEQHDMVYPMVPSGADLHAMIRRPHPQFEDMSM
jgi:acetolactate synthase-1/2/3 large subunit